MMYIFVFGKWCGMGETLFKTKCSLRVMSLLLTISEIFLGIRLARYS